MLQPECSPYSRSIKRSKGPKKHSRLTRLTSSRGRLLMMRRRAAFCLMCCMFCVLFIPYPYLYKTNKMHHLSAATLLLGGFVQKVRSDKMRVILADPFFSCTHYLMYTRMSDFRIRILYYLSPDLFRLSCFIEDSTTLNLLSLATTKRI